MAHLSQALPRIKLFQYHESCFLYVRKKTIQILLSWLINSEAIKILTYFLSYLLFRGNIFREARRMEGLEYYINKSGFGTSEDNVKDTLYTTHLQTWKKLYGNGFWIVIWAVTWQNQQSDCAPCKDSDQPGHPPSLIRVFDLRSMGN